MSEARVALLVMTDRNFFFFFYAKSDYYYYQYALSDYFNYSEATLLAPLSGIIFLLILTENKNCYTIQLHGDICVSELAKLKELRAEVVVFKSLVIGESTQHRLEEMIAELSPYVEAFITDTYDPKTGASGATGKTHDWAISRKFVELSPKPVILAGGLSGDNVREAIMAVKPAGVDAHTGVEGADGRKDVEMIQHFVREAQAGFATIE